jgi:hypothetical protein
MATQRGGGDRGGRQVFFFLGGGAVCSELPLTLEISQNNPAKILLSSKNMKYIYIYIYIYFCKKVLSSSKTMTGRQVSRQCAASG